MRKTIEGLMVSFPSMITVMIASASFTVWALNYFQSQSDASEFRKDVKEEVLEFRNDIKQIKDDVSFIKGRLKQRRE